MTDEIKLGGVFDDLPEGTMPAPKEEKAEEPKATAKKEPALKEDADELTAQLAEKDAIAKEERERRKAESKKRRELEAEVAQLKEAAIEATEEKPVPPPEMVRKVIQEENYKNEVIRNIRAIPGINRPLAEELQKLVDQLPKSGDSEADVRGALAYLNATKGQPATPSFNAGFGATITKSPTQVSESAIRLGQEKYKLTPEDFKRHGGERNL